GRDRRSGTWEDSGDEADDRTPQPWKSALSEVISGRQESAGQPRDGLRVRTHHRARQDLADSENTDDRDDRIDSLEKSEAAERETGQPRLQFDSHRRDRDADDDGGQTEHRDRKSTRLNSSHVS